MGLLQNAAETYDCFASRAGIFEEGKAVLAPISHSTAAAKLEITLDRDGSFLSARAVGKEEPKVIIPVTESSAGRTIKPIPHPLCEQLGYLAPIDPVKHKAYLAQLADWANSPFSHPKLRPILTYVQSGTILSDLLGGGLIELNNKGRPADEKMLVRWVVNGLQAQSGPCWTDQDLFASFIRYYADKQQAAQPALCMITGKVLPPAAQHPKGILPIDGNAKLISANDDRNFTYRGRFLESWQAATVSYAASQKAHNALRWVAANQGVSAVFGGKTFLCWNPQGIPLPPVTGAMRRPSGSMQPAVRPSEYRAQLQDALRGWKMDLPVQAGVVIAAFDAATTGRLALTYYHELAASDFLQRLYDWDVTCCAENGMFGIQSPPLSQIANYAFGTLRDGKLTADDRILSQQMQRLLACRIDRVPLPLDLMRALLKKASNLQLYDKNLRQRLLFTACAAIIKYHFDHNREECSMALDENNTNRSYLFGRLLAVAEALERSTYDNETGRETNAIRMQPVFVQRPMHTWTALQLRLRPYCAKLGKTKPGLLQYYQGLIQQITSQLSPDAPDINHKLDDVYLLGYYHQRAFRKQNTLEEPDQSNP